MPWTSGRSEGAQSHIEQIETVWPSSAWSPSADVLVTEETVLVRVELAGIAPGDVRVRATRREVMVWGLRREPGGTPRPRRIDRMEICHGPFARTIALPEPVRPEEAEARLADGLLEIVLPLAESSEPAPDLVLTIVVVGQGR